MSHVVEFYTLIGSSIHRGRSAVQCVRVSIPALCQAVPLLLEPLPFL